MKTKAKVLVSLRLPVWILNALNAEAKARGMTRTALIVSVLLGVQEQRKAKPASRA